MVESRYTFNQIRVCFNEAVEAVNVFSDAMEKEPLLNKEQRRRLFISCAMLRAVALDLVNDLQKITEGT